MRFPGKRRHEFDEDMMSLLGDPPSILSPYAPVITIRGEIDQQTAAAFHSATEKLKHQRKTEVAMIEISSVGGEVFAAFEILNTMKASGIHWITYNKSHAFSAGALILSAGEMRVMAPLATAMIHGMSGGIGYKGIEEISAEVQHDVQLNDMLLDEIAKNCKTTVAKLKKMIKDSGSRDLWLMPQDALKLKLVEKIGVAALNPVMGFQLDIAEQGLKEKTK